MRNLPGRLERGERKACRERGRGEMRGKADKQGVEVGEKRTEWMNAKEGQRVRKEEKEKGKK